MRTSLTELRQAVAFLKGWLKTDEALVYESRLLTDPALQTNLSLLQKVFSMLKIYHRKQLKQEAEQIHQQLFQNPEKAAFRLQIQKIFPQAGKASS